MFVVFLSILLGQRKGSLGGKQVVINVLHKPKNFAHYYFGHEIFERKKQK